MKKIGSIVIIVLIFIFIIMGFNYIHYREANALSDAAFIKSDKLLFLSFKVGGKVIKLTKTEAQYIKKGETLAQIDPVDFLLQKKKLENEIGSLIAKKRALEIKKSKTKQTLEVKLDILKNKKDKLTSNINSLQYNIKAIKANYTKLNNDIQKFKTLFKQKLIQKEKLEVLNTKQQELSNQIFAKQSLLTASKLDFKDIQYNIKLIKIEHKSIKELEQNIKSLDNKIKSLEDTKQSIQNQITYTTLKSPIDGIVAKRFINNNTIVSKGSFIYSIVDPTDIHLEVLLSEKKLNGVKIGNNVEIEFDAIDGKKFKGKVSSILPASASTFSLVPRDIASGEFTKLDQRFIVRIDILNPTKNLRVGYSASVAIEKTN